MTFSRRYAERRAHLKHLRKSIAIGIFGSFANEYKPILYEAQKFLIDSDSGFATVKLSYDLENDHPRNAQEQRDDYNLRMSDLHPININESALMELTAHRKTQDLSTAYLLIQNGVQFAGIGKGTTRNYQYEEFDEYKTTFPGTLKFCQNRVHRTIQLQKWKDI